MKQHRTATAVLLGALALAAPAAGQVPLTPRALGMGGAYVASARGHEALLLNPANLGLAGTPGWSIAFPQLGAGSTLLGPGFETVPEILDYDKLEQARRDELLALVPESGTELRVDSRLPLFALQVGGFAVGASYGMVGEHTLGRDLVDLLLNGYEQGRTDYSVGDTRGSRASYLDVAAGYGRRVGPLSLGVTGHYYHGRSLVRSRLLEPRFDLEARDVEIDYLGVLAEGGAGWGVDVGAALQPHPSVTLSAAVGNAWSRMEWSEELRVRSVTVKGSELTDGDVLLWYRDQYERSGRPLDAQGERLEVYQTAAPLYEEAFFPATLRVGAAWAPAAGTEVGAAYHDQLTPGRLGGWWERSLGVGVQQKLPLVRVRAGYATDLAEGRMLSGGLSLGPLELGAAKLTDAGSGPRSGWIATFGLSARAR